MCAMLATLWALPSQRLQAQSLVEYAIVDALTPILQGQDSLGTIPSVVDAFGNVVVAGRNVDPANPANINAVVRKFDAQLNELWSVQWDSPEGYKDAVTDVQIDSVGNIYVTGYSGTHFPFNFMNPDLIPGNIRQRLFVLKYSADGQLLWAFQYGDRTGQPRFAAGIRLVLDRQTPYIAGVDADAFFPYESYRFRDVTSFDSVGSGVRMMLVKLNDNGTLHWRRFWRGNNVGSMPGGLVFAGGHVHLAGQIRNANRDNDLGLFKIRPDGTTAWSRFYSHQDSNSLEFPQALTADSVGNLFVAGHTKFNGQTDYLLLHYRPNGRLGWALTYDAPQGGNDWANDIVYARGHVYATGQSARDLVTLKIRAADGTPVWTQRHNARGTTNTTDTTGYDRPYGVLVDANDNVFVGGVSSVSTQLFNSAVPAAQFFLMQYSADGAQQQEYKQLSDNFPEAILPFYIYKGITKDTLGNIYLISARGDSTGSNLENPVYNVIWELLKFGDVGTVVRENKDSIRTNFDMVSVGLLGLKNNAAFTQAVRAKALQNGPTEMDYAVYLFDLAEDLPWLADSIAHYNTQSGHTATATQVNEVLSGFNFGQIAVYPSIFFPQLDTNHFRLRCWDGFTPERIAYFDTYRDSIPFFDQTVESATSKRYASTTQAYSENQLEQVPTWYVSAKLHPANTAVNPARAGINNTDPTGRFWAKCKGVSATSKKVCSNCGCQNIVGGCPKYGFECFASGGLEITKGCGRTGLFNDNCSIDYYTTTTDPNFKLSFNE